MMRRSWTYPVDAASTTTLATSTRCVLVHVVSFTGAVSIVVAWANRAASIRLPVDERHAWDRVIIVVRVLVSPLDKLLLGLLESKRPHKPLPIVWDVDVSHIAWVVDSWLPLQVIATTVVLSRLLLLKWMPMALIDGVLCSLGVQVVLTIYRLQWIFVLEVREDCVSRTCSRNEWLIWALSLQTGFKRSVHRFELWNVSGRSVSHFMLRVLIIILFLGVVPNWDLSH